MPRQHTHQAVGNQAAVGVEVDVAQLVGGVAHHGQRVVRVGVGVAVAGEVLGGGNDAVALQTLHVSHRLAGHVVAVLAERAVADYGVVGIAVDVGDGREVDVDAQAAAVLPDLVAHAVNQAVVADGAQHHLLGENHRAVEPHPQPPLAVDADEQRHFRLRLVAIGEYGLAVRPALEENQTP